MIRYKIQLSIIIDYRFELSNGPPMVISPSQARYASSWLWRSSLCFTAWCSILWWYSSRPCTYVMQHGMISLLLHFLDALCLNHSRHWFTALNLYSLDLLLRLWNNKQFARQSWMPGNQTVTDKYWQNNKVLLLEKWMELCTFLTVCIQSFRNEIWKKDVIQNTNWV